jgi:hypothetical protein
MSETINVQSAPKIYQSYLKQDVDEEAQAKSAATAFCSEKPETDCQKFLEFLSAYGYKFDPKSLKHEPPVSAARADQVYSKWKLVIGLFGFESRFSDPYTYTSNTFIDANGQPVQTLERSNNYENGLTPGIGLRYKPSYDFSVDANLRSVLSTFSMQVAYSWEIDSQFTYTIWHKVADAYDELRVNLGLGPAMLLNLYNKKSSYSLVESLPPPSVQTRIALGEKASLEIEANEFISVSFEFMRLTNMDGRSSMGVSLYFKLYLPENPIIPHDLRPCIWCPNPYWP